MLDNKKEDSGASFKRKASSPKSRTVNKFSDNSFKRKSKRRKSGSDTVDCEIPFKRTKRLKLNSADSDNDLEVETKTPKPENLNPMIMREGMLILGCVKKIAKASFEMSLPGCLYGTVTANNISDAFSEAVTQTTLDPNQKEIEISSFIECGMVFPCKINSLVSETSKGSSMKILLSIKPDDVNGNLRPSSLYPKMVLYVSICSIEDHGYVVDVGTECIHGFLPKQNCHKFDKLLPGQLIPTFIQKILFSDKNSAKVQLSKLDFDEEFPSVSFETVKLHSILPGTRINVDIIEIKKHFVIMKYFDFDVCANLFFNGSSDKHIKIGSSMQATVLCVNPITNMIHVTLQSIPTPKKFHKWFEFQKYQCVKMQKFLYFYKKQAHFKISRRCYGFINVQDLPAITGGMATSSSSAKTDIEKACVINFFYMDNLVQLTAKPSFLENKIILPQNVQVGDIYEAVVKGHVEYGMFVSICIGLKGLVPRIHFSDVYVTKPEMLYPVGNVARCRVLYSDGKGKIQLTCKESLLNLQMSEIPTSYNAIQKDDIFTGVISKITDSYMLISSFNNIKGIVSSSYIPSASIFFEGQTVTCQVLGCTPKTEKLKLSLKTDSLYQYPKDSSFVNPAPFVKSGLQLNKKACSPKSNSNDIACPSNSPDPISSHKHIALISGIKGLQLNVTLKNGNGRGRVHITEVGCKKEGIYPLQQFKKEQKVKVYILGKTMGKKKKSLEIETDRNMVSFNECSLTFPPSSYAVNIKPGESLIGFVNKTKESFATLWLTPTETGVLDYLHFSRNPKIVRKLSKSLKTGLSLKVKVLDISVASKKQSRNITLSRLDATMPEVGKNVLALVQTDFLDKGLILKLPFGYYGSVSITDLSDVYTTVQTQFKRFLRLKYVLCHVLEVNHETKYCLLSLRKSRVSGKNASCPEITVDCMKEGDIVKGLVIPSSDNVISVTIGRNLEGNVNLHFCATKKCRMCSLSKSIIEKYQVGSVIEVNIHKILVGKSLVFTLPEIKEEENHINADKISICDDIFWEEMQ